MIKILLVLLLFFVSGFSDEKEDNTITTVGQLVEFIDLNVKSLGSNDYKTRKVAKENIVHLYDLEFENFNAKQFIEIVLMAHHIRHKDDPEMSDNTLTMLKKLIPKRIYGHSGMRLLHLQTELTDLVKGLSNVNEGMVNFIEFNKKEKRENVAVVVDVEKDSPADKAGIKSQDVIIIKKMDGAIRIYELSHSIDDKYTVTIFRDDKKFDKEITLIRKKELYEEDKPFGKAVVNFLIEHLKKQVEKSMIENQQKDSRKGDEK